MHRTKALSDVERAGSPTGVLETTHNVGRSNGRPELTAIVCASDPGAPLGERYCIRHACAEITNSEEFCDVLEKAFYRR
jgi:hypothetical protein